MKNINGCLSVVLMGFGLALGGGAVYGLFVSESARLFFAFLGGGFLLGGTILLTMIIINRQWVRAIGDAKVTNNYRLNMPAPNPQFFGGWPGQQDQIVEPQPEQLLPPIESVSVAHPMNQEDEIRV